MSAIDVTVGKQRAVEHRILLIALIDAIHFIESIL